MVVNMSTYLQQLEAMDEDRRFATCKAMLDTMYAIAHQLGGLADNRPVIVKDYDEHKSPEDNSHPLGDRFVCLKLLENDNIVDLKLLSEYKYVLSGGNGDDYLATVINRYAFEELLLALQKIDAKLSNYDGYEKSIEEETVPNLAYYDTVSGIGMVNGNPVHLKGRNRRLFNALFLAAPHSVNKENLKGIVRYRHKDDPIKYAMNDAFSAVRKACKVDKSVIMQRGDTGKLNAKVFPLSFQLFQNTYGTTEIKPKKRPL